MKILLLTTHLNMGGISVYTANLAKYLRRQGIEVTVASSGGYFEGMLKTEGIQHMCFDIKTSSEWGLKMLRSVFPLARFVEKEKFDIVHAQTRLTHVLAFLSGKISGVPYVTTCHGFFKHKRLIRRLFPCWGNRVIAISKGVMKHLIEDFSVPAGKVTLVYNGVEPEKYKSVGVKDHALAARIGLNESKITIGTIGRLVSIKGQRYLVDAFKNILLTRADVQLLIVGEGPEENMLRDRIRKFGMEKSVFLLSGDFDSLDRYFSLMDVFCMPSLNEGLGIVLMEAMASARACVASDTGGLSELIEDGKDGFLVKPGDEVALSSAISRILSDEILKVRFGKEAREKAVKNFSMEKTASRTIEVYEEALRDNRGL